jgi:cytochrome oxidase Cu insertion factor (SCO1/SenC/PrrC family)
MNKEPAYKEKAEAVLKVDLWQRAPAIAIICGFYFLLMVLLFAGGESAPEVFPAPDFSVEDIMGKGRDKVTLSDFKGRPILIYFFASW